MITSPIETKFNKINFKQEITFYEIIRDHIQQFLIKRKRKISLIFVLIQLFFIYQYIYSSQLNNGLMISNHEIITYNKNNDFKIERYGSRNASSVTVISMYFKLGKSKHSHEKYLKWLNNFLLSVSAPLVIFTDKNASIVDQIKLRKYPTSLYVTESIWDVMREISKERNKNYMHNYLHTQNLLDREKHLHNPSLYAIWNLKSFISEKIAKDNFYQSSMFIYTDGNKMYLFFNVRVLLTYLVKISKTKLNDESPFLW